MKREMEIDDFQVGDRVRAINEHPINYDLRGQLGTVASMESDRVVVSVDNRPGPTGGNWRFQAKYLTLDVPEPTDEEVAILFGLAAPKPCPHCGGTGITREEVDE